MTWEFRCRSRASYAMMASETEEKIRPSPAEPTRLVVRWYRPMIISCEGRVTGRPSDGFRMLFEDSIRMRASAWASGLSGRWTAIWSPSKSALKAPQTNG
ncbi:hypothetical protein D3C73_1453050 [compost metagenome]